MRTDQNGRLRIFVAAPSDVDAERERLSVVVRELDDTLGDVLEQPLKIVGWRDVPPSMGRPQQVILDQLGQKSWDIFIGILWTRFGSPTGAP